MLWFGFTKAQAPTKFYTTFGGYGHDIGYGVKQTLDRHYIVTGSTSSFGMGNTDVLLAKIDSMGWVRWQKSYGGFNNDIGKQVIQLSDSGFVIAGYTNSFGAGGYDVYVVRTDKNGVLIWQKTFGGMNWDFANDIILAQDGNIIVCGKTYSTGYGKSDGYIIKADMLNGSLIWQKTYGGIEDDEFSSVLLTYNNKYALVGTTKSTGDIKGDCWLFKTGLLGDSLLSIKYGDSKKQLINDFVEASNGDFVLAGATENTKVDTTWGYLLSVDQNGVFIYDNYFTRSEKFKDYQFATLAKGSYFNSYMYIYKTFDAPAGFKLEPLYMKFNGMWPNNLNTYGSLADEEIFDVCKTKDNGYISVGYSTGFNSQLTDVFLVKTDSTILGSPSIVGVKEIEAEPNNNYKVFPTVTKNFITIEIPQDNKRCLVSIKNSLGQLIEEKIITSTTFIDLEKFTSGIYFITIDNLRTFKVIKTE